MNGLRTAMIVAFASAASCGWAADESRIGQPIGAAPSATVKLSPPARRLDLPSLERPPARFAGALAELKSEAPGATRGAKESQVYRDAAPSVVLVVTKDVLGSGVLVSADGKIVTNLHVVGDDDRVGVIFKPAQDGAQIGKADVRPARVLRRDEVADLALIQVQEVPAGAQPLKLAAGDAVQVGSDVHAIGHPTGESWTYTRGIVSQIRRDYDWKADGDRLEHRATVIQTQTPINPGNSGGPLLDDALEVVGINSFSGEGEGLNFAVSAEDVRTFLARSDDRLEPKASRRKRKAAKTCETEALSEEKVRGGVETELDTNCDGKPDARLFEPNSKREPMMLALDQDGDGKIDSVLYDYDHDEEFDEAEYDSDGDGKMDLRGLLRKGEEEPYRYERIR